MDKEEKQSSNYSKRPLWQWAVLYVVIGLIIYAGVYYFFLAKRTGYGYTPPSSSTASTMPTPSSAATNAETITVTGNEFAFNPSQISVKKGQAVQITFKNTGKYPHNFTISDLNVSTQNVDPGSEASVTFTPDKTGQFEFICTVPGHADKGMKGTLTVQ